MERMALDPASDLEVGDIVNVERFEKIVGGDQHPEPDQRGGGPFRDASRQ